MHLGPLEIGLIIVLVLIIFGAGKLPQVGEAIGKSLREFRKASRGEGEDVEVKSTKKTRKAKSSTEGKKA
jgi:sec-independent protein translocase protein TatA